MEFNFWGGSGFLENFVVWRLLSIEGRLGGGKTLLSVALAKWLYEEGYVRGVFANFPIDPEYIPDVRSCVQTAVILDEGWSFSDARSSAKEYKGYGAYFRKLGSWFISPSVYKVDRRMRPVACERAFDLFVIKAWWYRWLDVRNSKGQFLFRGYESLFNRYDHRFIPSDDGGILETMKAEIASLSGSRKQIYIPPSRAAGRAISPYDNPLGKEFENA